MVTVLFALFWMFVGCTIGYVLASMVYAWKLDEEKQRIERNAVATLQKLQKRQDVSRWN